MKTKKLKFQEKLLIIRLRLGLNSKEMAEAYNMSRSTYSKFENGAGATGHVRFSEEVQTIAEELNPWIQPHEECLIRRRRLGTTQQDMADFIGKSRNWLMLMEAGNANCENYLDFLISVRK